MLAGSKNFALLLILLSVLASCQYFKAEKISRQTYLKEEVESINWKDIDSYPMLDGCSELSEKEQQKRCFTDKVSRVMQAIISRNMATTNLQLKDTVYIQFLISEKPELLVTDIVIKAETLEVLPNLEALLRGSTDSLILIAPAYKRGIPVKTSFTLPVVFYSTQL